MDILNWYDLFRQVYPDSDIVVSEEDRMRTVDVNGQKKTYKLGMTQKEYTPWAKHIPQNVNHPLLGSYMTDYLNRAEVRRALHIPDTLPAW